jgi:predicted CXXCH cytochrome family protein
VVHGEKTTCFNLQNIERKREKKLWEVFRMSKEKFGLSFLVAMAMMLVFSISAMAAGVTGLKANVENGKILASWAIEEGATQYKVNVKDITGATPVAVATDVVVTTNSFTTAVTDSKKYEISVLSDVEGAVAAKVEIWAPASNSEVSRGDETADNNIGNANNTGTGAAVEDGTKAIGPDGVIKSGGMVKNDGTTGTHRTHGEYQNNTNSCASCHQTHTGASKALLFKDGVYNTCTACHDGTLGMYNVFEHSNAGTFGGTEAGNMSVHMADGSVQVKAAPGGNLSANSGSWVNEFNCASCHSPHGSYSDRLLHYNPNGMGIATKTEGGIGLKGDAIVDFANLPTAASGLTAKVVRGTGTQLGITGLTTEKVIAVMEVYQDPTTKAWSWKTSTTPWLYGYVYGSPKNYYTRFFNIAENSTGWNTKSADGTDYINIIDNHDDEEELVNLEYNKGYVVEVTAGVLDNIKTANIARAYAVNLDLVEIAKFGDAKGVPVYQSNVNTLYSGVDASGSKTDAQGQPWKGTGVQMSTYCASCHTDYLAASGSATGTFNKAYRHTTTSDSYTCVRCHFAHGTDVTVMMDAEGRDADKLVNEGVFADKAAAENYLLDQNPSSALKRYTNMSVCWGCHTDSKAEQLKNTFSYGDSTDPKQPDPHGLDKQPDMPGAIADSNGDKIVENGN